MAEHCTKGGYESADIPASELGPFPNVLTRPGMGTATPEPQDAVPHVPNLPCPKCGETGTTMRYCDGSYTLTWGMCGDRTGTDGHFHRACTRCTCQWVTYDVLAAR